jgi:phospholipase/lecithinase/hemolysin
MQSQISSEHNERLYKRLALLQSRLPRLHLIVVKFDPLFRRLLETMEWHVPLIETVAPYPGMSACLFVDPSQCLDVPAWVFNANLPFLFWDVVHPTAEAHRHLADYLYEQLADSY